ncbi:hypothetical protein Q4O60_07340 [Aeribacillus pallidus]|jgi:hypothetical protein|uniref:hypothetical protein n=1 Tax=Aeribacillus composti TaxID=1868734 RepID=UPI0028725E68|nr:hypothetical protein [Aeribacillus pallidus]
MTIKIDETGWPIVTISMGEEYTSEMLHQYTAYWENWLSRKTAFGVLIIQTSDKKAKPSKEVTQAYLQWCKQNRSSIAKYCIGIATVVPTDHLLVLYKPVAALSTRKTYGCPGNVFKSEEEAVNWLKELYHKQKIAK